MTNMAILVTLSPTSRLASLSHRPFASLGKHKSGFFLAYQSQH
jgi:hypothetical protein